MSDVRRAIFYSVANQYSLQIFLFVAGAIIARLLTPEEIGLFTVATSVAFLATSLRSFGVNEYLIREKEVQPQTVRSTLGVMVIMSWGMGAALMLGAGFVADFYGEPDLKWVLMIITVPFFFAPYSSVPFALMTRDLKFDVILKIEIVGALVRHGSCIGLVWAGMSYWGLAWGTLAGVMTEFLMITLFRPKNMHWLPSFRGIYQIFKVGIQITTIKLLDTFSQNVSELALGRLASMHAVGLFSRGVGLTTVLNSVLVNAVGPVALPHLAQVKREGGSVAEAYINAVALIGAFSIPLFAVVNLCATPLIVAIFGDQWGVSGGIASILAIWAMIQALHCFSLQALLAESRERLVLFKEIFSFATKIILIVVLVPYGLKYVAWAFVISGVLDFFVISLLMRLALGITILQLLRAFIPNFIVAGSCWAVLKVITQVVDFGSINPWLAVLITGCSMTPVWVLTLWLTRNRAWPHVVQILSGLFSKLGLVKA